MHCVVETKPNPIADALDPRTLLRQELARRCEKNPRYSLRAFARALGMSHTVLSLVLSGKRPPSRGVLTKAVETLSLSAEERAALLEKWNTASARRSILSIGYQQIDLDKVAVISEWHYFAILSLLEVRGARWEARWISRRLGIPEVMASAAMERLERMGLVAKQGARWRQTGLPLKVENSVSTPATRRFQHQILEKAIHSLENDPMEVRHMSSTTLAMDPSQIPYAREKIRQFRRQLARSLERKGPRTVVYNLATQIYPISQRGEDQ